MWIFLSVSFSIFLARGHPTGDGKKFASNFWKIFGTRFSQVFGIICISGGYQDVRTGFYQVFTLHTVGISRFQREKPTRNLPEKDEKIYKNPIKNPLYLFFLIFSNRFLVGFPL